MRVTPIGGGVILQNDRKLVLSIGSSRNSKNWVQTEMMWSEFIDRLRVPQRTPETFDEYMKMSKRQKSELKDIGGFVGGSCKGPAARRPLSRGATW